MSAITAQAEKYAPNWDSLDKRPTPAWFEEARFGIFVVWGPYSVPSWAPKGKYAEWYGHEMRRQGSPTQAFHAKTYGKDFKYEQFGPMLTAEMWEPDAWADLFVKSGGKYVVFMANYHDGYCLWPSPYNKGWNSVDIGPKRDLLGEMTQAVRKRGLKMGIYYSLYEWFHPLWLGDRDRFVAEHFQPQFKDVVTRYAPSIIFADGEWEMDFKKWRTEELMAWLFNESPCRGDVVINDRWGKCRGRHGGYYTSEYGGHTDAKLGPSHIWEENRGMGASYGYNRNESIHEYGSVAELVRLLCATVADGGNLLLCVGPTADGRIPVIMQERLLQIGEWLGTNGEAIYGAKASPLGPKKLEWGVCTSKPGRVYAHVFGGRTGEIELPGLQSEIAAAYLLADKGKKALATRRVEAGGFVKLPERLPDDAVSVIVVEIEGKLVKTTK
ncbi:MAG: alpha-L-fucosidase [Phycisphaerae bacterium]|nr:alpha-L-fucosidase [Phycisphaerae bacterium]